MSRRRNTDFWDDLFDGLRWLFTLIHPAWSLLIAAAFYLAPLAWFKYKIKTPQLQTLGYILGVIPAMVSLIAGVAAWRYRRDRKLFLERHVDIGFLNSLSWQEFERQVAEVYRQQGYRVEEIGGGGADGGVDLRLRRDGLITIVQCKRWRTFKIGVKYVRELFGVMMAERVDRAIFVTSGVYTDEALRFGEGKPLTLVDGAQLAQMLRRFQQSLKQTMEPSMPSINPAPQTAMPAEVPARPKCPLCGSEMLLRRAKKGIHAGKEFWGCSTYPKTKCGGIREVL